MKETCLGFQSKAWKKKRALGKEILGKKGWLGVRLNRVKTKT
jgi:hypothetical protein